MNPTRTASHRKYPTFSLKKNIEKIVVKIGAANVMLTTVAKGRFLKAVKIESNAAKPKKHLDRCNKGRLVK